MISEAMQALYAGERERGEALLVAQLDAAEIEDAVLHGGEHLLAAPRRVALVERGDDADPEMQPGAAVTDLRAGDQWQPVAEARGRRRTGSGWGWPGW